jgi:inorganic pyrophosphatase
MNAWRKDGSVNVLVESPRGSTVKFKYDPDEDVMTLSRPLPAGVVFPFDWGSIPGTKAADGDPLDAFILWDGTTPPGIVIPCRPIGVLQVEQTEPASKQRERNDRVAVVPVPAPRQDEIKSTAQLAQRVRQEIEQFFLHSVAFEGKQLRILGWRGPEAALAAIRAAAGKKGSRRK